MLYNAMNVFDNCSQRRQRIRLISNEKEIIQNVCNDWLKGKTSTAKQKFESDGFFKNFVALSAFEAFCSKHVLDLSRKSIRTNVIRADTACFNCTVLSTMPSYLKVLAPENLLDGSEKLKAAAISSFTKTIVEKDLPNLAAGVSNHCLQLFKDAMPTDCVDEMNTEKWRSDKFS